MDRDSESWSPEPIDDLSESQMVCRGRDRIENNSPLRGEDANNVLPEYLIVELLGDDIVDKEVHNDESVAFWGLSDKYIGILTDDLDVRVGIESKSLSCYLDDDRVDVNRSDRVG